ncbi:MAG: HNH endonuclease signature motif containing protein [Bdellovibrionota bacterium]
MRPVSQTHTELKILVDEKLLKEIEELRSLMAHRYPHASIKEVLAFAVTKTLERVKPKAPKVLAAPALEVNTAKAQDKGNSRYIPQEVKRQVWQRDKGQCTYENGGRRCTSKHALEFDHIRAFAKGGGATEENLRLRCRAHNQLEAIKVLGHKKMANYIPRMRESLHV